MIPFFLPKEIATRTSLLAAALFKEASSGRFTLDLTQHLLLSLTKIAWSSPLSPKTVPHLSTLRLPGFFLNAVPTWGNSHCLPVNLHTSWLLTTSDTGGEVEDPISGRLLHDSFKRRGAGLFGRFSPQPAHQLNDVHGGSNGHMAQMRFR